MFPSSAIPRPEYPRPDRQRGLIEGVDWLNLNGPWQFRFDPQRRGHDEQWFGRSGPEWREQIIVPFCWESLAAWGEADAAGNDHFYSTRVFLKPLEVTRENHRIAARHEVGWYRRRIEIPDNAHWRNHRIILTIGAADFATDCWCNGVHCGHREGGYVPHEFDLTDALTAGDADSPAREALLVLRVEDPMDNREQPVGKQWGWYTPTSGIWQTVFLEPRAATYIDNFRIVSDIDQGRVSFEVACAGLQPNTTALVAIIPPDAPPHQLALTISGSVATGDTEVYPVSLWDTADPKLYRVVFRLLEDEREVDVVRSYFGMRKIGTVPATDVNAPAMLSLNNKPIYLRGALYQSYHPDGVYTATDARTLCRDISFAREAGFDFLRIHIKLDDPLLLYHADTQGMLLMQDFPNFGEGGDTPLGRQRFEEMLRLGLARDFNHPSIIAWCIFNETWGFGGQTELMKVILPTSRATKEEVKEAAQKLINTSSFKWVHEMWQLAKSLDPTRLIEDMSVVAWEHLAAYGHVDTDINSWHFYLDDYAKAKAHIENVIAKTHTGSSFNYIEGYQQRGVPLINSEYGGVGALDGDRDVSWSFKFLTNELRVHGQLSAYIYTELHDVEWEYNGLLNYDRTPKEFGYPPSMINQGDVLPINAPPIAQHAPGSTVEVEVFSSHFSRRRREGVTLQWLVSGMDTLGTHHPQLTRGRARIPFTHHRVELAQRIQVRLPEQPMLCALSVAAVTADGQPVASNYVQHFVCGAPPPEREETANSLILRRRVTDWTDAEWSESHATREDAIKAGCCYGYGAGYFEWEFTDELIPLIGQARRVRVLCEVSSRRIDTPQTDAHRHPTSFELLINDLPVHRTLLPDHPHDSRGALSYLRGGRGGFGYLMRGAIEGELLQQVAAAGARHGTMRLRCAVPADTFPQGGLSVYDYDCGRYPIGPTILIEWEQG
ncbi:glycoside hydrolase family 2 protein [Opitutus terrae]|uniref:Glycoside hydrolase family 2 sugar binding n=1 Tax=Opitutus terrae (strain DSM 11246 / JCM 15787 / PB90-1) TaxID=452637 RepID=B1ZWE3_OPITP|nr:glycoside hydrolase family 2 [Opitutus terrae]ACB76899.1 glycoside hydrolase family 2 sugar binding [Opitutus terrae PB90-1]